MADTIFTRVETTPTNVVADIKAAILTSAVWTNPAGQRVVATTPRGADMVVDLADAAATNVKLQMGVYRTAALADKVTRYLSWRASGGASSDFLHAFVSAGPSHLYISINGPYTGEANANNERDTFYIGDIAPYFASDMTPAVLLVAHTTGSGVSGYTTVHVSRNAANSASWVAANIGTVCHPSASASTSQFNLTGLAASDSNALYLWPYVVCEQTAGLRGRAADVYYCGWAGLSLTGFGELQEIEIDSRTFIALRAFFNASGSNTQPFGSSSGSGTGIFPVIALPYAD